MPEISDDELSQLRAAVARVGELEGDAAIGKAHREAETARIAKEIDKLPAADRRLVEGEADLQRRGALLERLMGARPRPPEPVPGGGPPGINFSPDFEKAWREGDFEDARRKDPAGAAAWMQKQTATAPRMHGTSITSMLKAVLKR